MARRLAELLRGTREAAAYRVHADRDLDELVATVRGAGWDLVRADTSDAPTTSSVIERFRVAFGFPERFGSDLGALADSLGDVPGEPGMVFLWDRSAAFAEADPDQFDAVLRVLVDRASREAAGRFVTLLRG